MGSGFSSKVCFTLCLGAAVVLAGGVAVAEPTGKLVRFTFDTTAQLDALHASGLYDVCEVMGHHALAIRKLSKPGAQEAKAAKVEAGLHGMEVLLNNVDDQLATFRAQGNVGKYHTYESALAEINDLVAKYPQLLKTESIGKSYEGRDLQAIRLQSNAGLAAEKPHVLVFGLTHAREWISAELPFYVLHYLLDNYGKDPKVNELVDGMVLYIIPVLNPDGLNYSQTQYSMWRKNRSPQDGGFGVDVNRNFPVGFGNGSSDSVDSDIYHGPQPNSELETRALEALFEREKFVSSLSFHSYSELVLFPWGYDEALTDDNAEFTKRAQAMADLNGYTAGQVSRILYVAGGATDDTFYKNYGAWAYTFELGQQFVPPDDQIESICKQNLPAVLLFLKSSLDGHRPSTGATLRKRVELSNFFSLYDIYPLR